MPKLPPLGPQVQNSGPSQLQIGTACVQTTIYRLTIVKMAISKKVTFARALQVGKLFHIVNIGGGAGFFILHFTLCRKLLIYTQASCKQ